MSAEKNFMWTVERACAALIVHPPAIYTVRSGSNDGVAHTHSVDLLQSSVPGALVMLQLVITLIVYSLIVTVSRQI